MGGQPDGAELTARYLDRVVKLGLSAAELTAATRDSAVLADMPHLSRPVFLGADERRRLHADVDLVRQALVSVPDRLYGGDFAAFARAAGLSEAQIGAVVRESGMQPTGFARADLYQEKTRFRLLEVNFGSAIAGVDSGDISEAMLAHPALAAFAHEHGLGYPDSMRMLVDLVFAETGHAPGSFPSVAIIDWPEHYHTVSGNLRKIARRWRSMGLDAQAGHLGELEFAEGRVWLNGRRLDVVFRLFLLEHLAAPDGPALIDPVLEAADRGEVTVFTSLASELYGSKAALAMLSDPANRHLLSAAEQAAVDRVLPWTVVARPGPVTLEGGQVVDLLDYAASHPDDLVIKPALLHGGLGVVAGWDPGLTPRQWRESLAGAMDGPYVIQRRSHPQLDLCPGENGELVPWVLTWGVLTMAGEYGGVWARAFPARSGQLIQRVGAGAYLATCLHADPDSA